MLDERAVHHVEDRGDFLARIYSEHEECMRDHRKAGDSELDSETVCSLRQLVELSVRQIR